MNKRRFTALVLAAALIPASLAAETTCRASVLYRWKPAAAETAQEVVLRRSEAHGADEAAAKAALAQQVSAFTREAQDSCRRTHENLARCMSSKYAALAPSLQAASFSARKAMEEAIGADCKKLQGVCTEVASKDEGCVAQAQSSSESAAKEEKGKKKK